jgi:dTDP-4-amino-4,6-dideoxygalactose transaminase
LLAARVGVVGGAFVTVPFIDLVRQYATIRDEIDTAVLDVVRSGQFILGEHGRALEQAFAACAGAAHAIAVGSGTDALRLALEAVGIRAGDEVITTPFTFFATAEMISQIGAVPVFADIDPETYCIEPRDIEQHLTARTRAIIPVHLYGHPADMTAILGLAKRRGLFVIEDAAQAVRAEHRGQRIGGLGDLGCFSFYPTKNLGAYGDAGMITTNDAALADRLRMLRQHGQRDRYVHESLGWSSRLDEIQAAVLRVKLRHLEAWTVRRRALADRYRELLAGLPLRLPRDRADVFAVYHLFTVATDRRDDLRAFLSRHGIATAVHYPVPIHRQEPYLAGAVSLPASERAAKEVLSLPLFPEMTDQELKTVAATVHEFFARRS